MQINSKRSSVGGLDCSDKCKDNCLSYKISHQKIWHWFASIISLVAFSVTGGLGLWIQWGSSTTIHKHIHDSLCLLKSARPVGLPWFDPWAAWQERACHLRICSAKHPWKPLAWSKHSSRLRLGDFSPSPLLTQRLSRARFPMYIITDSESLEIQLCFLFANSVSFPYWHSKLTSDPSMVRSQFEQVSNSFLSTSKVIQKWPQILNAILLRDPFYWIVARCRLGLQVFALASQLTSVVAVLPFSLLPREPDPLSCPKMIKQGQLGECWHGAAVYYSVYAQNSWNHQGWSILWLWWLWFVL